MRRWLGHVTLSRAALAADSRLPRRYSPPPGWERTQVPAVKADSPKDFYQPDANAAQGHLDFKSIIGINSRQPAWHTASCYNMPAAVGNQFLVRIVAESRNYADGEKAWMCQIAKTPGTLVKLKDSDSAWWSMATAWVEISRCL